MTEGGSGPVAIVGVDGSDHSLAAQAFAEALVGAEGSVRTIFADGATDAAEVLVADAIATSADLIVIGAHRGPAGVPRSIGSVTHKVLRHAPCPVVVVKAGGIDADASAPVVVGIGDGRATEVALAWAERYARAGHRVLRLVRAVDLHPMIGRDDPFEVMASYIDPKQLLRWATDEVESLRSTLATDDLVVEASVDWGSAGGRLVERSADASLVVVGKHFDGRLTGYLTGRCLHHVLTHATCPVVVVGATPEWGEGS